MFRTKLLVQLLNTTVSIAKWIPAPAIQSVFVLCTVEVKIVFNHNYSICAYIWIWSSKLCISVKSVASSRSRVWKCIYLLKTFHHFEEQRQNTISCSLWRKTNDTKSNVHGRGWTFITYILPAVLPRKIGYHTDWWTNGQSKVNHFITSLKAINFKCFEGRLFKEKALLCSVWQTLLFIKLDLINIWFLTHGHSQQYMQWIWLRPLTNIWILQRTG
jgi:hypothetical protein